MKKLLFLTSLLLLLSLFQTISSCSPNEFEDEQKQEQFDAFASKALLLSLPLEDQKQAWLTRLKMYQSLDLSIHQKEILEQIIADIKEMGNGTFFLSEKLRIDAVAMAKATPQIDFINLFCEVTSLLPALQNTGPVCADYIINDLRVDVGPIPNSNTQVTYRIVDCDCNWTCGQQAANCPGEATIEEGCTGGATTACCNPTGGCGLFGMGTCNGHVNCSEN